MPRAEKGAGKHHCPLCDKRFTRSSDVQRHITGMHTRERPFPCARYPHGCNFTASQKCNRKAHYKSHPDCAKEAKILERIQEIASVKSEKVISPQTQTTYATPVAARRPRKRTKASASRVALRLYPSRDAHLSEASTSGSSAIEQTSHEASPPMHHLQLHLSQHTQELEQVDIAFDWESLSSYPQTQLDLGFQAIASQPWDQQQYSCFPAYSNDQLVQDPYMKGFFSLPVPVELSTCFDDPALPNILSGVYATGNISAPLPLDIAQPGPALENLFDFMISADVQAESERMVRENPPSPSVLNSLPLIDGQVYPSIWAMLDLQSSSCFVC